MAASNIGKREPEAISTDPCHRWYQEIWNSSTGLWQPLAEPSATEEPVKVRVQDPQDRCVNFNGTGYGFVRSPHGTDATYAYYPIRRQRPSSLWLLALPQAGLYRDVPNVGRE